MIVKKDHFLIILKTHIKWVLITKRPKYKIGTLLRPKRSLRSRPWGQTNCALKLN